MKICVCILAIDKDVCYFDFLMNNLKDSIHGVEYNFLVITRETDLLTIDKFKKDATVLAVPPYEISHRHNMEQLGKKRNLGMEYAQIKGFDAIFFVDTDILINRKIFQEIMDCSKTADIVVVPYEHILTGANTVARIQNGIVQYVDAKEFIEDKYYEINGAGAGCTLIGKKAFGIKFEVKGTKELIGEDIGFFLNCINKDLIIKCLSGQYSAWHIFEKNKLKAKYNV